MCLHIYIFYTSMCLFILFYTSFINNEICWMRYNNIIRIFVCIICIRDAGRTSAMVESLVADWVGALLSPQCCFAIRVGLYRTACKLLLLWGLAGMILLIVAVISVEFPTRLL